MKYTMQILSNEEFDRLPYKDVETSFGLADPKTNTAYVRRTGLKPMDAYTAMHELEHLEEGGGGVHASHYRNGVYYKGFGDVMGQILPIAASFIPGIGPMLGPAIGAGMSMTGNMGLDTQKAKAPDSTNYGGGQSFNQPQAPQVSAPQVSQAQTPGGAAGTGQTGSPMNMEKLRGMLSGRSPQDESSLMGQFGMGQGTGRMA